VGVFKGEGFGYGGGESGYSYGSGYFTGAEC